MVQPGVLSSSSSPIFFGGEGRGGGRPKRTADRGEDSEIVMSASILDSIEKFFHCSTVTILT